MWKSNTKEDVTFSLYKIDINVKIDCDPSLITQWITQLFR